MEIIASFFYSPVNITELFVNSRNLYTTISQRTNVIDYTPVMKKEQLLKKLGERIREIRKEKGLTQVELANTIGKDQQSIQRLETGNINPSYFYLLELAKGLDMTIVDLLDF